MTTPRFLPRHLPAPVAREIGGAVGGQDLAHHDPQGYWSRSPLSLVGNVKTPTLVVVGAEDYRTPVSESEQYYTALVKVPGASHGFTSRPSQSAAKAAAIIAWFDRYRTKPGTPPAN